MVVNSCFRCFSSAPGAPTPVGRCILTVIFLLDVVDKEPANIHRGQGSFSVTFFSFRP